MKDDNMKILRMCVLVDNDKLTEITEIMDKWYPQNLHLQSALQLQNETVFIEQQPFS